MAAEWLHFVHECGVTPGAASAAPGKLKCMPCIRLVCGWLAYPGLVSTLQREARVPHGGKDVCSLLLVLARVGSCPVENASIVEHNFRENWCLKNDPAVDGTPLQAAQFGSALAQLTHPEHRATL